MIQEQEAAPFLINAGWRKKTGKNDSVNGWWRVTVCINNTSKASMAVPSIRGVQIMAGNRNPDAESFGVRTGTGCNNYKVVQ